MRSKIINFSAGPSQLPDVVLKKARTAIIKYPGLHKSILEINHRGTHFNEIYAELIAKFNELLPLPTGYSLLLIPGGASLQFSAIPMNFKFSKNIVTYVTSGEWSKRAEEEAKKIVSTDVIDKSEFIDTNLIAQYCKKNNPNYIHITSNETIDGIEYISVPTINPSVPLIADMSSNILSKPIEIDNYAMIYASTQKNIGVAGLCLIIIKDSLIEQSRNRLESMPSLLNYYQQYLKQSTFNTPNLFSWYITTLMLEWMIDQGGLEYFSLQNKIKSSLLYDYIDSSKLYINNVEPSWRSKMNVICDLHKPDLTNIFVETANAHGFENLKGHTCRGGLRFSLYNAMPVEAVKKLINFMREFERLANKPR